MHRLLLSRVCRGSCLIGRVGSRATLQVWEGTLGLICLSARNPSLCILKRGSSTDRGPFHPPLDPSHSSEEPSEEAVMDHKSKNSMEGKSKRSREFVSPLRPTGTKKKAKDRKTSSIEPLLICLDDIPLPNEVSSAKKQTPILDFIPLPPSPPPPLPPPLPSPPPPPEHSEMDEVLEDFFILDTTASGPLFPVPLPPSLSDSLANAGNSCDGPSSSKTPPPTYSIDSDPEDIAVVYNSDSTLQNRFQNINLVDNSKNSTHNTSTSSLDQIAIVYEGQWPWVLKSPRAALSGERNEQRLLNNISSPSNLQARNCHQSTKHSLRTVEKSPEPELIPPMGSSEPDIITLEPSTNSVRGRVSPEEFISFNTTQNSVFEENAEELLDLNFTKKGKNKRKSKKRNKKGTRISEGDSLETSYECVATVSNREPSPDIQKVGVVDPDVVELDNSLPSTSHCVDVEDMEVVDVLDSDAESIDLNRTSSSFEDNSEVVRTSSASEDNYEVVDVAESDNESISSSGQDVDISGDSSGQGVDISDGDFISFGNVNAEALENTEIDLDDSVLDKRNLLERLRKWNMTRLGEEVLVNGNVRRKDTIFSLMSYNVLAQQLLVDNRYLYNACDETHLPWKYRWALLQYEIGDLDPDVLLLQEVQASHYYSHFLPWLTYKGYEGLYKKRTGEKCDGCAIFYKKNKFSLVESCSVEYLQPKSKKVLDRDNIGLIAKLASVNNPQACICVATTHFLYNPRRHDVKLAQAIVLLTELDRICYKEEKNGITSYCPIILSGDFNSEPHSALIDMLKEGRLHYEGLSSRTLTQHGTFPILGQELISPSLGITERCQHAVLAQSRFVEKTSGQLFSLSDKRKIEDSLIRLQNTDRGHKRLKGVEGGGHGPAPTGWYSHSFNFNSVYNHFSKRAAEATTFHNRWTSVDYILYSRIYAQNHGQPVEGSLKLLARYGLLTGPEASKFAPLPSSVCPSDHFPLAAQFLLRQK